MKIDIDMSRKVNDLHKILKAGAKPVGARAVFLIMNKFETLAKENINKSIYLTPAPGGPFKRSGKAKQSIVGQQTSGLSAKVSMGVKYGKYLEEGTGIYNGRQPYWTTFGGAISPIKYKGMKARPFWIPAKNETQKQIPSLIKKAVQDVKL